MNINLNSQTEVKPISQTSNKVPSPVKLKKKSKFAKWILPIILVIICVAGYAGYRALEFSNSIGIKVKAGDVINNIITKPTLKKDSTGKYTTALIVGLDTRAQGGTLNTDSMILATYNWETKNITMISIPRDIWVTIPGYSGKINGAYASGGATDNARMAYLSSTLTSMTGLEIQYKAVVDIEGFAKMIDAVGGVTVNVENSFTDNCYPAPKSVIDAHQAHRCGSLQDGWGMAVSFKKGIQNMDSKTALQYARSRHAPGIEGLDYARARRQQNVMEALKNKMLTSETLFNPQKVMEIIGAIQNNVQLFGLNLTDIQAAINLAQDYKKVPGGTYHFVLDPTFGGGRVIKECSVFVPKWISRQCPAAGFSNFTDIRAIVKLSLTHPEIYDEDPIVRVYDTGLGGTAAKAQAQALMTKYPYLDIRYFGTLNVKVKGTTVYYNEKKYAGSVAEIAGYLNTTNITKPSSMTLNLSGQNVTILLGKPVTTTTTN